MTPKRKYPNPRTLSEHLLHITDLRIEAQAAQRDLEDALMALHDSRWWEEVTYAQLATVMGVSRQAVQQRVSRLLGAASGRRRDKTPPTHPGQLTID